MPPPHDNTPRVSPSAPLRWWPRLRAALRWLAPSVGLALIPKCPMCVAAYLAIGTGLSVSLPVAEALRAGLLALCLGSLVWLTLGTVRRFYRRRSTH